MGQQEMVLFLFFFFICTGKSENFSQIHKHPHYLVTFEKVFDGNGRVTYKEVLTKQAISPQKQTSTSYKHKISGRQQNLLHYKIIILVKKKI